MENITEKIKLSGLMPVIAIDDPGNAVPLAKALMRGGLYTAEVTFRTAGAAEAIENIARECPDMLVGAGTVLTAQQVDNAAAAGAKFFVTPGFDPAIVKYALEKQIPIFPGAITPGEIAQAMALGLKTVKFFPAEQSGGLDFLKAVCGPYRDLTFIPTGGVNAGNLVHYLDYDKVLACGGSWMVKKELIDAGRFNEIEHLTREAINTMLGFEFAHLGINFSGSEGASKGAEQLQQAFGFSCDEGNSSIFCATRTIELLKAPGRGTCGHIAVRTNSIARALYYLERRGLHADESSWLVKEGKAIAVYLQESVGGFSIHLLQK